MCACVCVPTLANPEKLSDYTPMVYHHVSEVVDDGMMINFFDYSAEFPIQYYIQVPIGKVWGVYPYPEWSRATYNEAIKDYSSLDLYREQERLTRAWYQSNDPRTTGGIFDPISAVIAPHTITGWQSDFADKIGQGLTPGFTVPTPIPTPEPRAPVPTPTPTPTIKAPDPTPYWDEVPKLPMCVRSPSVTIGKVKVSKGALIEAYGINVGPASYHFMTDDTGAFGQGPWTAQLLIQGRTGVNGRYYNIPEATNIYLYVEGKMALLRVVGETAWRTWIPYYPGTAVNLEIAVV